MKTAAPAACLVLAIAARAAMAGAPAASVEGTAPGTVATAACGGAAFRVEVSHASAHPLDNTYRLYGGPHGAPGQLLYTTDVGGWFHAACVKDGAGRPRLLFQSSCGGSGCPEDRFGIVDPATLALLLRPPTGRHGNIKDADRLLRLRTPWIANDGSAFCCDSR
ncbi:MAG: hypothetical protein ACTHL8_11375 [Burkholderiaceae bacterium]